MNVFVNIPDDIAARLDESGSDLGRRVLEALVIENLRVGRMTRDEVREALGFEVDQVDQLLKAHGLQHVEAHPGLIGGEVDGVNALATGPIDQHRLNLAESIRRRFASVGGVDDLVIPPREPMREPPRLDR